MPDRTGFKKVDYASGVAHIPQLKDYPTRFTSPTAGCKRARQSTRRRRYKPVQGETVTLRQVPHHQRNGDAAQPPAKLNTPPVKPIRRIGARERPATRLSKQNRCRRMPAPSAHNHHRIVGVVRTHNAGGDQKPQIIGVLRAKPSEKPLRTRDPRPSQRAGRQ